MIGHLRLGVSGAPGRKELCPAKTTSIHIDHCPMTRLTTPINVNLFSIRLNDVDPYTR